MCILFCRGLMYKALIKLLKTINKNDIHVYFLFALTSIYHIYNFDTFRCQEKHLIFNSQFQKDYNYMETGLLY